MWYQFIHLFWIQIVTKWRVFVFLVMVVFREKSGFARVCSPELKPEAMRFFALAFDRKGARLYAPGRFGTRRSLLDAEG